MFLTIRILHFPLWFLFSYLLRKSANFSQSSTKKTKKHNIAYSIHKQKSIQQKSKNTVICNGYLIGEAELGAEAMVDFEPKAFFFFKYFNVFHFYDLNMIYCFCACFVLIIFEGFW